MPGSIFKDGSRVGDQVAQVIDFNGAGPQHRSRANDDPEPVDRGKIEAALDVVSSDCSYKVWLNVAAGLHSELGEHGFELFDRWSAKATGTVVENGKPEPRYTPAKSRERWRGARTMHSITIATLFHYADQADPAWRQRYDDEEKQRAFARMAAGAGASNSAGTSGAGTGSTEPAAQEPRAEPDAGAGTASPQPSLIPATPYVWIDPANIPQRDWLYGRLLIRKFVTATVAPGGLGKSSLITAETLSQVSGKDLLGVTPNESTARLALEPGRPAGRNPAQDPGGRQALQAEAGRYREPAVCRQRARPAARHRDNQPEMVAP